LLKDFSVNDIAKSISIVLNTPQRVCGGYGVLNTPNREIVNLYLKVTSFQKNFYIRIDD